MELADQLLRITAQEGVGKQDLEGFLGSSHPSLLRPLDHRRQA
jgi:hypothetical protein